MYTTAAAIVVVLWVKLFISMAYIYEYTWFWIVKRKTSEVILLTSKAKQVSHKRRCSMFHPLWLALLFTLNNFPYNTFRQWCVNNFYYWHFIVRNGGCTSFEYLYPSIFWMPIRPWFCQLLLENPCSLFPNKFEFAFVFFFFSILALSLSFTVWLLLFSIE